MKLHQIQLPWSYINKILHIEYAFDSESYVSVDLWPCFVLLSKWVKMSSCLVAYTSSLLFFLLHIQYKLVFFYFWNLELASPSYLEKLFLFFWCFPKSTWPPSIIVRIMDYVELLYFCEYFSLYSFKAQFNWSDCRTLVHKQFKLGSQILMHKANRFYTHIRCTFTYIFHCMWTTISVL